MQASFREIWDRISGVQKINIYTHAGPDGDSLGSCVGLRRMILQEKPQAHVKVITLDSLAGKLAECDIAKETQSTDEEAELYVYPDTPTKNQVTAQHSPSICIDHHIMRNLEMNMTYVKLWPSCAGLFFHEFNSLGLNVTPTVAEALLVGAVTDTGCGIYGDVATRAKALDDIKALDAVCGKYRRSYVNTFWGLSLNQEKTMTKFIDNIKMKDKVLILQVPNEISSSLNLSDLRMTLQELTHRVPADYFMWCYEQKGKMKFSIRGDGKDLQEFAKKFNGGGHSGAASFESDKKPQDIFDDFCNYVKS